MFIADSPAPQALVSSPAPTASFGESFFNNALGVVSKVIDYKMTKKSNAPQPLAVDDLPGTTPAQNVVSALNVKTGLIVGGAILGVVVLVLLARKSS